MELPSAVFDQISSGRKPQYALLSMLMSFAVLLICIIELVYTCQKKKSCVEMDKCITLVLLSA